MNKLWLRLTISYLVITLLTVGAVAWVVERSVTSSFSQYIRVSNMARLGDDLVAELEAYYADHGGWDGVESLLHGRGGGQGAGRGGSDRGSQAFVVDASDRIVAATNEAWAGALASTIGPNRQIDLHYQGERIGALGEQTPGTVALNDAETQFLQQTTHGLLITGLLAGGMTVLLGFGLSYNLTRPLHRLTEHISGWRLGGDQQPVPVGGTEEIQRLGSAFNDLLVRLANGEAQRQRMSADLAHELRTPVTIMRGHLEAMMDGVYPLDTAHLAVAYDQILHLSRLVEDLRLLTQAEAGRLPLKLSPVDINQLISSAAERFAPLAADQQVELSTHLSSTAAIIQADADRIQQVIDNLLNNAVRHTAPSGSIRIQVNRNHRQLSVSIYNDTATPISEEEIAHLFDRFWRGDDARARDSGGSGLGLAITRGLLRLHGGDISVEAAGDGLLMTFTLPT